VAARAGGRADGRDKPSTRTLARFAKATGHKLKISLEPVREGKKRKTG